MVVARVTMMMDLEMVRVDLGSVVEDEDVALVGVVVVVDLGGVVEVGVVALVGVVEVDLVGVVEVDLARSDPMTPLEVVTTQIHLRSSEVEEEVEEEVEGVGNTQPASLSLTVTTVWTILKEHVPRKEYAS